MEDRLAGRVPGRPQTALQMRLCVGACRGFSLTGSRTGCPPRRSGLVAVLVKDRLAGATFPRQMPRDGGRLLAGELRGDGLRRGQELRDEADRSSFRETRPAWVDTLMAATAHPWRLRRTVGRAAHADLELLVEDGVAQPPDLDDGVAELVRPVSVWSVRGSTGADPGQEGVELVVGQLGQQRSPEGGGGGRAGGSRARSRRS